MKKRIIALSLVLTMAVGILNGCGSSGTKSDTMTVSEMLETVLEDNSGELYFYTTDTRYDHEIPLGKSRRMDVYSYDGESVVRCRKVGSDDIQCALGQIANKETSFEKTEEKDKVLGLDLETDKTGNEVYLEVLKTETHRGSKDFEVYYLGGFSRIEIYGTTYMCFATRQTDFYDDRKTEIYFLIEDTESTKDKTIVWDELGTEGILVDEAYIRQEIYAPIIPQPAD